MIAAVLPKRTILAVAGVAVVLLVVAVLGIVMAITGAGLGCSSASASSSTGAAATSEIPPARLRLYQAAGRRFDIDWAFLASIGAQECHHGSCAGDNGSGCAGPMQIAVRARLAVQPRQRRDVVGALRRRCRPRRHHRSR